MLGNLRADFLRTPSMGGYLELDVLLGEGVILEAKPKEDP